ncbi:FTR1 family iron permease [Motiliproteus sp.]|uniref:FTR1 family iron permease n=1 Tax=Motiliproteus sp. TaxID=1898955 RepID=UPI003BA87C4A
MKREQGSAWEGAFSDRGSAAWASRLRGLLLMLGLLLGSTAWAEATDYPLVMSQVIERGDRAVAGYSSDEAVRYGNEFSDLYFGGFEGMGLELAVAQADQQAMLEIEMAFSRLIGAAVSGKPASEVESLWSSLRAQLVRAPMIDNSDSGFWSVAIQSLLILLREGVEALLVIAALVAYLRKAGAADRVVLIWIGVGAALVASVLTAWALQGLISNSGAARETIEGATMLVAAVLLSYVSFWLFSRREMQQWQGFIHNKLGDAVSSGSLMAIVSVAFFAVYREGAETILFYQALVADVGDSLEPIATGFGLALLLLGAVYLAIFQLSVRLPLKQFFSGTAALLFVLAVVFAGKSVLELQVAGWIPNTYLEGLATVGWLGIFPSLESLALQAVFIAVPVLAWMLTMKKRRADEVGAQAKPQS